MQDFISEQVDVGAIKSLSQENLGPGNNNNAHVTFSIPEIDKKKNMLYADEFLGLLDKEPAAKRIRSQHKQRTTMLIGASGSGKTATCLEIARHSKTIYIDCYADTDLKFVISLMVQKAGRTEKEELSEYCCSYYSLLLLVRDQLLQKIMRKELNKENQTWRWFTYQRTESFQIQVKATIVLLLKQFNVYGFRFGLVESKNIILDEAHVLQEVLENKFYSKSLRSFCRPLLYALVGCNFDHGLKTIYVGTHISLKDHSLIESGVGEEKEDVFIETGFDYYTPDDIRIMLSKVLTGEAFTYLESPSGLLFLFECCWYLQGRVRFFSSFLKKLADANCEKNATSAAFLESFKDVLDRYIRKVVTLDNNPESKTSLYNFWQRNDFNTLQPLDKSSSTILAVREGLIMCLIDYFTGSGRVMAGVHLDLVKSGLVRLHSDDDDYSYTMSEPLALRAGFNYLRDSQKENDFLSDHIVSKMGGLITPQIFGHLFELLVAVRTLRGRWKAISEDDPILLELRNDVADKIKKLEPPKFNIKQNSKGPSDWALLNFTSNQEYFVLPDSKLGPDGLWKFMCFNLKTSQKKTVTSGACAKNYLMTDVSNWCTTEDERKRRADTSVESALGGYSFSPR